jgi:hypothetical protein
VVGGGGHGSSLRAAEIGTAECTPEQLC